MQSLNKMTISTKGQFLKVKKNASTEKYNNQIENFTRGFNKRIGRRMD